MMAKQALRVCGSGLLSPKGPPGPGWAKAPLGGCCTGGGGGGWGSTPHDRELRSVFNSGILVP